MKILASYPAGLARLDELKRDLALLATSGQDWADQTRRLAAQFPRLDIFSLRFVERYSFGWRLTRKGEIALEMMEAHVRAARQVSTQQLEGAVYDLAVGDSVQQTAIVRSVASGAVLAPLERRSRFRVIGGGKT